VLQVNLLVQNVKLGGRSQLLLQGFPGTETSGSPCAYVHVCSVAERYAPNNAWYIQTITQLFEISGDMVAPQVANNLMSLIAEGTG
jgi:hypothetical protein